MNVQNTSQYLRHLGAVQINIMPFEVKNAQAFF